MDIEKLIAVLSPNGGGCDKKCKACELGVYVKGRWYCRAPSVAGEALQKLAEEKKLLIKLRTDEDLLTVDEAVATINRLRKENRKLRRFTHGD